MRLCKGESTRRGRRYIASVEIEVPREGLKVSRGDIYVEPQELGAEVSGAGDLARDPAWRTL